jgi:hypothetical protein
MVAEKGGTQEWHSTIPTYHCILFYTPLAHVIQPKALVPSEGHHMVIITNNTVNGRASRMKGNIWMYVGSGGVTA